MLDRMMRIRLTCKRIRKGSGSLYLGRNICRLIMDDEGYQVITGIRPEIAALIAKYGEFSHIGSLENKRGRSCCFALSRGSSPAFGWTRLRRVQKRFAQSVYTMPASIAQDSRGKRDRGITEGLGWQAGELTMSRWMCAAGIQASGNRMAGTVPRRWVDPSQTRPASNL